MSVFPLYGICFDLQQLLEARDVQVRYPHGSAAEMIRDIEDELLEQLRALEIGKRA